MTKEVTLNQVTDCLENQIVEAFFCGSSNININTDMDKSDIQQELQELSINPSYSVDYYHEALSIIDNSQFYNHPSSSEIENNFDSCKSAMECVMLEARNCIDSIIGGEVSEIISNLSDSIYHVIETALELGFDGKLSFTSGYRFGYFAHESETCEGLAIYQGNYKIDGELDGVEHVIASGLCASCCWSKAA